jgi:hypothetical protein
LLLGLAHPIDPKSILEQPEPPDKQHQRDHPDQDQRDKAP